MAYRTRNFDARFSEAQLLSLSPYNIAFTGTLFVVITKVVDMDPVHEKIISWRVVGNSLQQFGLPLATVAQD